MDDKTIETVQKAVDEQADVIIGLAIAISVLTFFVAAYFPEALGETDASWDLPFIAPAFVVGLLGIVVGALHGLIMSLGETTGARLMKAGLHALGGAFGGGTIGAVIGIGLFILFFVLGLLWLWVGSLL